MRRNIGGLESALRVVLGASIIALGVFHKSWWGALGVLPIVTAALGWCPVYAFLRRPKRMEGNENR